MYHSVWWWNWVQIGVAATSLEPQLGQLTDQKLITKDRNIKFSSVLFSCAIFYVLLSFILSYLLFKYAILCMKTCIKLLYNISYMKNWFSPNQFASETCHLPPATCHMQCVTLVWKLSKRYKKFFKGCGNIFKILSRNMRTIVLNPK